MVKTLPFDARGVGSIPGQGTKVPRATKCGQLKKKMLARERMLANHVPDKGLISKIYKELIQFNNRNPKQSNLKIS